MRDFPGGSAVKNLPASAGDARDLGPIPGSGRSPGERWQPTPVLLPGKPYGRRSLAGCSPWGHKSVRHDLVTNRGRNRPTLSSDTTRKSGNAWPRSGGRGSEDTLSPNVVLCVCVCVCVCVCWEWEAGSQTTQFSNNRFMSTNSAPSGQCSPRIRIRSHRLGAQSHEATHTRFRH